MRFKVLFVAVVLGIFLLSLALPQFARADAPQGGQAAKFARVHINPANSYYGYGFEPYIEFDFTPAENFTLSPLGASTVYDNNLINFSFDAYYRDGAVTKGVRLNTFKWLRLQSVSVTVFKTRPKASELPNGTLDEVGEQYSEVVQREEWVADAGPFGSDFVAGQTYHYRLVAPAGALDFDRIKQVKWTMCLVNTCLDPSWTAYSEISELYSNWSSTQNNPWTFMSMQSNGTLANMTYAANCNAAIGAYEGSTDACYYANWGSDHQAHVVKLSYANNLTIQPGAGSGQVFPNPVFRYYFDKTTGNYTINGSYTSRSPPFCTDSDGQNYTIYLNATQKCSGDLPATCSATGISCDLGNNIPAGSFVDFVFGSNSGSSYDLGNLSFKIYGAFTAGGALGYDNGSAQVNQTDAGQPTKFSVDLTDGTGLSAYITAIDNGNGTFVNSTPAIITGTANTTAYNFTITSAVGSTVRWYVWFNNTAGEGMSTGGGASGVTNYLETDLAGNWSTSNGNPWFFQYFAANGTRVNMTQDCTGTSGSNYQCWKSGESAQTSVGRYTTGNVSLQTGAGGGAAFPNVALRYYLASASANYVVKGTAWCKGDPFCNGAGGDGMNWSANLNSVQKCSGGITGAGGAFSLDCDLGADAGAGSYLEMTFGSNAGSSYDYGNFTLQLLRNDTGSSIAYSFTTTGVVDAVVQPMSVWGYFTGAGTGSNVTAFIDRVQKGVFIVGASGQYGLFDVQGNGTDYGKTLSLFTNNNTELNASTPFIPGKTERQDLPT